MSSVIKKIYSRLWRLFSKPKELHLLEMIWEGDQFSTFKFPAEAPYKLRHFDRKADEEAYQKLLKETDMGLCPLDYWEKHLLPSGFFVVEHLQSGKLVGACFASHHPSHRHPFAGNLGWLVVDKEHRGHRIGQMLVSHVVGRLKSAGYERIYLETHDFRLPALVLYFKTGWQPYLYNDDVACRWEKICEHLSIPFQKNKWDARKLNY